MKKILLTCLGLILLVVSVYGAPSVGAGNNTGVPADVSLWFNSTSLKPYGADGVFWTQIGPDEDPHFIWPPNYPSIPGVCVQVIRAGIEGNTAITATTILVGVLFSDDKGLSFQAKWGDEIKVFKPGYAELSFKLPATAPDYHRMVYGEDITKPATIAAYRINLRKLYYISSVTKLQPFTSGLQK